MKVLVAEDETEIRKGLVEILQSEGFTVLEAENGDKAIALFQQESPDFVCLDIMMPGKSGYDVCRAIRTDNDSVPVVFISAKSEEIDKVVGFELGADDYIMKPFGVREVVARVRAIARRCRKEEASASGMENFPFGDLTVDQREMSAKREGSSGIELSLREISILKLLAENESKVVDRDMLLDRCWGQDYMPNSRTLDQHIAKLRKKIELDSKDPKLIQTVYGAGYRYISSS